MLRRGRFFTLKAPAVAVAVVLSAQLILAGCGNDSSGEAGAADAGTYAMEAAVADTSVTEAMEDTSVTEAAADTSVTETMAAEVTTDIRVTEGIDINMSDVYVQPSDIERIVLPGTNVAVKKDKGFGYDPDVIYPTYEYVNFASIFDLSNAGKQENIDGSHASHCIYSQPIFPNNSNQFTGFLIDFKADYTGKGTYWSLCSFKMDTTCLEDQYKSITGGGAYCGLQFRYDGTKAIMSFWNIYCDDKVITPTLVYPVVGGEGHFDNEGEGANYIPSYEWRSGQWYRMYLNCYDDPATKHTFVEMWVQDLATGVWTEIVCYDTKLTGSCMTGGMTQFLENFDRRFYTEPRSFEYANIYVREKGSDSWKFSPYSYLSIDTFHKDVTRGTYTFGATGTSYYGIVCGYGPDAAANLTDVEQVFSVAPVGDINDIVLPK